MKRANGGGEVVLPAGYVAEHVELAYASTAHRAQGRTVDTAHAMVSPTTTREVLYVSPPEAARATCSTSTPTTTPTPRPPTTKRPSRPAARRCSAGVLRNEGADVAAHDMIRRAQNEAEGIERLSAEYLTLATAAQAERWDALLEAVRAHDDRPRGRPLPATPTVRCSRPSARPRPAASTSRRPSPIWLPAAPWATPTTWPPCSTLGSIAGCRRPAAGDRGSDDLIAGLIPRVEESAIRRWPGLWPSATRRWRRGPARWRAKRSRREKTGCAGSDPPQMIEGTGHAGCARSRPIAAYRDRWHITGPRTLGGGDDVTTVEQRSQLQRALAAGERARAMSQAVGATETSTGHAVEIDALRGIRTMSKVRSSPQLLPAQDRVQRCLDASADHRPLRRVVLDVGRGIPTATAPQSRGEARPGLGCQGGVGCCSTRRGGLAVRGEPVLLGRRIGASGSARRSSSARGDRQPVP